MGRNKKSIARTPKGSDTFFVRTTIGDREFVQEVSVDSISKSFGEAMDEVRSRRENKTKSFTDHLKALFSEDRGCNDYKAEAYIG